MADKTKLSFFINTCIVLFLLFVFGKLPAVGGMTQQGMQVIGVFAGTIFGWVTIGIGWPSLLGVVALGMTDFYTMSDLLALALGSQMITMILCLLLISAFVQQAELTDMILHSLLGLKCAQGKPFLILFFFLLAGFFASILSHCLAVLIIFLELFRNMMKKTGIEPYSSAVPCFFVGMAYAFALGDIALPFKTTAIVGIGAYEAATGTPMNFAAFTVFIFPFCIFLIATYVLSAKYLFRCDLGCLQSYALDPSQKVEMTTRKKISLLAVIIALLLLLLPNILPAGNIVSDTIRQMGIGGLGLTIVAVLLMVRVDGEPLMDLKKTSSYFSWDVLFMLAFLVPVASALASDQAGIKALLMSGTTAFLQEIPSWLLVLSIVTTGAFITNFSNNTVVCGVFVPIACMLTPMLNLNPQIITSLIIAASCIAIFFPAASPLSAVLFSQKELVTFRQQCGLGLKTFVVQCVIIAFAGLAWGRLVF